MTPHNRVPLSITLSRTLKLEFANYASLPLACDIIVLILSHPAFELTMTESFLPAKPVAERIITGGSLLLLNNSNLNHIERQSSNESGRNPTSIYKTGVVGLSPLPKDLLKLCLFLNASLDDQTNLASQLIYWFHQISSDRKCITKCANLLDNQRTM